MSDWSQTARERFMWLVRVAKLRGASVRMGPYEECQQGSEMSERKTIEIDMGDDAAKWGRWFLNVASAGVGADLEACEWMAACWLLLCELARAEGADEAKARVFARRVLEELTRDNLMTEPEAAELCGRIARETISGKSAKVLH